MPRALLLVEAKNSRGDITSGAQVSVRKLDGSAMTQIMYDAEEAGTVVTSPLTANNTGIARAWAEFPEDVEARVGSGPWFSAQFASVYAVADGSHSIKVDAANGRADIATSMALKGPRPYLDPRAFGAKCDALCISNARFTSGVAFLEMANTAEYTFTAADIGKTVTIDKAGAANQPLQTTITAYDDTSGGTRVAIGVAPSASVVIASGENYAVFGTDDTAAWLAAIAAADDAAATGAGTSLRFSGSSIVTASLVISNPRVGIFGEGRAHVGPNQRGIATSCIYAVGSSFTQSCVIGVNMQADMLTPVGLSSYYAGNHLSNFQIRNANDIVQAVEASFNLSAVKVGTTGFVADNMLVSNFTVAFRSFTGGSGEYADRPEFKKLMLIGQRNPGTLGSASGNYSITWARCDALTIENVTFDATSGGVHGSNGINLTDCGSGEIRSVVAASMFLNRCYALTISALHGELDPVIRIRDPRGVSIRDSYFQRSGATLPIILERVSGYSTAANPGGNVTLDSVLFHYLGTTLDQSQYDVQVHSSLTVSVTNCKRRWSPVADQTQGGEYGIKIKNESAVAVAAWDNVAGIVSQRGEYLRGEVYYQAALGRFGTASGNATLGSITLNGPTWGIVGDTYYYAADIMYDVNRMLGILGARQSIVTVQGNAGPLIPVDDNFARPGYTVRLFRWVSTNVFPSWYVDIPLSGTIGYLHDQGNRVNGYVWNQINLSQVSGNIAYATLLRDDTGPNSHVFNAIPAGPGVSGTNFNATAVPTRGSWAIGDRIWTTTPTSGATPGWVCTATGKAYPAGTGDTTNGTADVINVTNINSWQVGDPVVGTGVGTNAIVETVNRTTSTLHVSVNSTATGTVSIGAASFRAMANLA